MTLINQTTPFDCLARLTINRIPFILLGLALSIPACIALPDAHAASPARQTPDNGDSRLADTASRAQNTGGNYEFAAAQWEKLIRDFPKSALLGKAHFNAGICQIQTTEFQNAIDHFQSAIPLLKDEAVLKPHANLYLGFAQFKLGQDLKQASGPSEESTKLLTTSTQTLANLLKSNPNFPAADQACYFQAGAFEELDRAEDAVAAYKKIFEFPNPTFKFDGLFALADLQFQLGQFQQALKHGEQFRTEADLSGGHPSLFDVNLLVGKTLAKLATADENSGNAEGATEKLKRATEFFRQIADLDPTQQENENFAALADDARFQQAFCAVRLKQFSEAAALYEKIAANPDSPFADESLAFAGHSYIEAGKPDEAIETLKKSVASNSAFSAQAAHWLASVYLKTDQSEKAYDVASQWIASSSGDPIEVALRMDQADAAYDSPDRRKESVGLFNAIVSQFPQHPLAPSALYNSAVASLDTADFKSAVESADQFEASFKTDAYLPDTLDVKAEAFLLDNQLESATATLARLIADYPEHKKLLYWKLRSGLALFLQDKHAETIKQLTPILDALQSTAEKAEAHHWIGASQFHLKQFADAAVSLSASAETDANWRRADETLLALCRAQLASNQAEAGQATAKRLVTQFPQSKMLDELHFRIGEHAYSARQYNQASTSFDKVISAQSESKFLPFSLYSAAWSQLELDNHDQADRLFTKLIDQFPDHEISKRAVIGRSAARRQSGNTQSSIDELKKFLATAPAGPQQLEALFELGLAQVQASQWTGAVESFKTLIADFPEDPRADRFYYEMAWSQKELKQEKEALALFLKITKNFPESTFAGESNFHIGKFAYDAGNYDDSINAFTLCVDSKSSESVREKAAYKLAWAHYKQDQFQKARDQFDAQVKLFPKGNLTADGMFMVAESLFRLKQYEPALTAYLAAQPVVEAAKNIESNIKWLTQLHGAQSANKLKKYAEALRLAGPLANSDADIGFKYDAWLEMGSAHHGLKQPDQALENWQKASRDMGKTGARAFCMIGDHYFGNKQFTDAINQFKQVYFGFQGIQAEKDVRPWQAYAIYEAARCSFVQVKQAPDNIKPKLVSDAIKQFEYLLEHYGDDRLAEQAKKQLETLKKIDLN